MSLRYIHSFPGLRRAVAVGDIPGSSASGRAHGLLESEIVLVSLATTPSYLRGVSLIVYALRHIRQARQV